MTEIDLLEAIEESRVQLAQLENVGQNAFHPTNAQTSSTSEPVNIKLDGGVRPTEGANPATEPIGYADDVFEEISDIHPKGSPSERKVAEDPSASELHKPSSRPDVRASLDSRPQKARLKGEFERMPARDIQAFLVKARNTRRADEAHILLRQKALDDQTRCEVALLRHQRATHPKTADTEKFAQLTKNLERAVMVRYAADKSDLQRLLGVIRDEYAQKVLAVKDTIRSREVKGSPSRAHGSAYTSESARESPRQPLVASSGDKNSESIPEVVQHHSASLKSEISEEIEVEQILVPSESVDQITPRGSGSNSPLPMSVSAEFSEAETPGSSFADLLGKLRQARVKTHDTTYLAKKERRLNVSRQIAEDLVRKKQETSQWENRLNAEAQQINRLLDGVLIEKQTKSLDPRIEKHRSLRKQQSSIQPSISVTKDVDRVSEEVEEDIEAEHTVPDEISSHMVAESEQEESIIQEVSSLAQSQVDEVSEDFGEELRRSEAEVPTGFQHRESNADSYAESFEELSASRTTFVTENDRIRAIEKETKDLEDRIAHLKKQVTERRQLANEAYHDKLARQRAKMQKTETRLLQELKALNDVIKQSGKSLDDLSSSPPSTEDPPIAASARNRDASYPIPVGHKTVKLAKAASSAVVPIAAAQPPSVASAPSHINDVSESIEAVSEEIEEDVSSHISDDLAALPHVVTSEAPKENSYEDDFASPSEQPEITARQDVSPEHVTEEVIDEVPSELSISSITPSKASVKKQIILEHPSSPAEESEHVSVHEYQSDFDPPSARMADSTAEDDNRHLFAERLDSPRLPEEASEPTHHQKDLPSESSIEELVEEDADTSHVESLHPSEEEHLVHAPSEIFPQEEIPLEGPTTSLDLLGNESTAELVAETVLSELIGEAITVMMGLKRKRPAVPSTIPIPDSLITPPSVEVSTLDTAPNNEGDIAVEMIMDDLLQDTLDKMLHIPGKMDTTFPCSPPSRQSSKTPSPIPSRPSAETAGEFVRKLLDVELLENVRYDATPTISMNIVPVMEDDEISPARQTLLIHATHEALTLMFKEHEKRRAQPLADWHGLRPRPLIKTQVIEGCVQRVSTWASYAERHGENLDGLLIAQIKEAEQLWKRRAEWEQIRWEAVADEIWSDLLDDTIGCLNHMPE
ncbi:hypothetical protein HKX48_003637 [Thoreauomyces humboldtii]|nr:hypothetical protein HKX48_003637 [Thoreauomyces humboldtii]